MENQIVKKMVSEIVESNEKLITGKKEDNKFIKIVPALMKRGVDNLNLSMFNPELKFSILTALGDEYQRKGNLNDAVKTFVLAGNQDRLNHVAEDYERIGQMDNCIEVYKLACNQDKLMQVGKKCLEIGRA